MVAVPETQPKRYAAPWLFLVLQLPSGAYNGLALVALPYLLSRAGFPVEKTSSLVALALLPQMWKPLFAPLLDLGVRRRNSYLFFGLLVSFGFVAILHALHANKTALLPLLLVATTTASAIADSALGSLCALSSDPQRRGQAAGYYAAGQLGLGGILGSAMLLLHLPSDGLSRLTAPWSLPAIAWLFFACALLCLLPVLWISEASPPAIALRPHLRALAAELSATLRTRPGWTTLCICASPLCAGGALNLFGALAADYHAGPTEVTLATGVSASLGFALGSVIGGRLADAMGSRRAYLCAGLLLAGVTIGLALSPTRPAFYAVGCLGYSICTGIGSATFFSFVFALIGPTVAATTTYGVLTGAAYLATSYVAFFDGQMYRFGGHLGLLSFDAASNLLGAALIAALLRRQPLTDPRLTPG